MTEGSTWGLAGRRFRRMIFLVFLASVESTVESSEVGAVSMVVVFVMVRSVAVSCGGELVWELGETSSEFEERVGGAIVSTSAILNLWLCRRYQ